MGCSYHLHPLWYHQMCIRDRYAPYRKLESDAYPDIMRIACLQHVKSCLLYTSVTHTGTSSEETQRLQKLCIHDWIYRNMHLFHLLMHVTLGSVVFACLSLFGLLWFRLVKFLLGHRGLWILFLTFGLLA